MAETKRSWLSETVILTGIPVIGYVVTYIYQASYNRVFGVPQELIHIDLTSVIQSIFSVSAIIGALYFFFGVKDIFKDTRNELQGVAHRAIYGVVFIVFTALIYINTDYTLSKTSYATLTLVIILFTDWISPFLFHWSTKGYLNKVIEAERVRRRGDPNPLSRLLFKITPNPFNLMVIILFTMFGAYSLGESHALGAKDFLQLEGTNEVVVKVLPDKIITAQYNDQHIIQRKLSIHSISDESPVKLVRYTGDRLLVPEKP